MSNPYNAPTADLSQERAGDETYEPLIWSIHGRIGRLRYLAYGALLLVAVLVLTTTISTMLAVFGPIALMIAAVLAYIPILAVGFTLAKRRLNDMNLSGWLSLLQLLPVACTMIWPRVAMVQLWAPLAGLVFWAWLIFWPGSKQENDFGLPPCRNSTGVVIGALILPAIFIIGIVAALSIPAYQSYMQRARGPQSALPAPDAVVPAAPS
ncbi:MAG TPA: DUF805 domain-containing protein [Telluria sp.]|nr:DUF805 domain-containing protein [Telluria sp.]